MGNAKYGCRLYIDTGNEHPNIITELTGIEPTSIEVKGDFIVTKKGIKKSLKQNLWNLEPTIKESDNDNIWDLCNSIIDITNILDSKEAEFIDIFRQFKNCGLMFYADMYNFWIQFRAQPDILAKMAKYRLYIDFSILSLNTEYENNVSD